MPRLFVALIPPASVRSELAALTSELEGVRVISAENVHLTLRFIGAATFEKEQDFGEALARVSVESFILPVGGIGVFPSRGPAKVLWAGVGSGHTRLFQLRKRVDESLLSVDPALEVRHFQPHFTLGRLVDDHDRKVLARFMKRNAKFEAPPFRVSEFQLMASEVVAGLAPLYRVIRTFKLAA